VRPQNDVHHFQVCLHLECDNVTAYLSAWNSSASAGSMFLKFNVGDFYSKMSSKFIFV